MLSESLRDLSRSRLCSLTTTITTDAISSEARPSEKSEISLVNSQDTKRSLDSSVKSSPVYASPPPSAFVSALQSPCVSPVNSNLPPVPRLEKSSPSSSPTPLAHPIPISSRKLQARDITNISQDLQTVTVDFNPETVDQTARLTSHLPVIGLSAPCVSFCFPVPRHSLMKGSISASSHIKLRSCDVYIGYHGQNPNLVRFCHWLKSELELQGIASVAADRAEYTDSQSLEIADRIVCSANFGIVVITTSSLSSPFTAEEIRFFSQKKNLVPLLFDTDYSLIYEFLELNCHGKEWRGMVDELMKCNESMPQASHTNWRSCICTISRTLRSKLGRISCTKTESEDLDEIPFPRNKYFVGRQQELTEIETAFFGSGYYEKDIFSKNSSTEESAHIETDAADICRRYASLGMKKHEVSILDPSLKPSSGLAVNKTSLLMPGSVSKKSVTKRNDSTCVVCIKGISGMGKTELALEFAYRYSQRYKKVLWVGGEARYFRQNILNLSMNFGLDVSAQKDERKGIRRFDEQEFEAFQLVKRELFRDLPYLLIIDNLEAEKEWWEGKDLNDLIPRNTGGTHVIITTQLPKVMNFVLVELPPLSSGEALILMKGRRKKDYPREELNVLRMFDESLGRLTYGLWLVGSLLSELVISPPVLFEAINSISSQYNLFFFNNYDLSYRSCPFLMKILEFCFTLMDKGSARKSFAVRMALVGAWLAPAPIQVTLIGAAAHMLSNEGSSFNQRRMLSMKHTKCYLAPHVRNNDSESALLLVKLGLARQASRQAGCWIQFHEITQMFAQRKGSLLAAKATVLGVGKRDDLNVDPNHLWALAFLVFGFKSEPPLVQLNAVDLAVHIKKVALPLAHNSFMNSRCNSAMELLKACTNVLEEIEKSFISQMPGGSSGSLCWKQKLQPVSWVDEKVWHDVTLLKATLLETRAKLLLGGGYFESAEELCRTCICIRTVMLGNEHAQTLAAQETLAKVVRLRNKI